MSQVSTDRAKEESTRGNKKWFTDFPCECRAREKYIERVVPVSMKATGTCALIDNMCLEKMTIIRNLSSGVRTRQVVLVRVTEQRTRIIASERKQLFSQPINRGHDSWQRIDYSKVWGILGPAGRTIRPGHAPSPAFLYRSSKHSK